MSITVMKLALDALEYEATRGNDGAYLLEREALRQAIEQAEKREWVGLTDDEMQQACYEAFSYDPYVIAKAIETKLKEKNT